MEWQEQLDALDFCEEHLGDVCRFLRYAVEARGGYALVEALEAGRTPEELNAGGERMSFGIVLPASALSEHMYVPRPVIRIDAWEKERDPYNGIALFSIDQLNLFVVGAEYCAKSLVDAVICNRPSLLNRYGAVSPAEFFAVATEFFFEKPIELKSVHPDLYEQLRLFYRRDPASLFEKARTETNCMP